MNTPPTLSLHSDSKMRRTGLFTQNYTPVQHDKPRPGFLIPSDFPQTVHKPVIVEPPAEAEKPPVYVFNQRAKPQTVQRKDYKHRSFMVSSTASPRFLNDERNVVKLDDRVVLGSSASAKLPSIPHKSPGRSATVNTIRILDYKMRYLSSISSDANSTTVQEEEPETEIETEKIILQDNFNASASRLNREMRRRDTFTRPVLFPSHEDSFDFLADQDRSIYSISTFQSPRSSQGTYTHSRVSSLSQSSYETSWTNDDMDSLFELYDVTNHSFQTTTMSSPTYTGSTIDSVSTIDSFPDYDFTPVAPLSIPSVTQLGEIEEQIQRQLASIYVDNTPAEAPKPVEKKKAAEQVKPQEQRKEVAAAAARHRQVYSSRALMPLYTNDSVDNFEGNNKVISFNFI